MKIAILDKQTLAIQSWYDAVAPAQSKYGGPWGDSQVTIHIGIDDEMDHRAVEFERVNNQVVAIEDEDKLEAIQLEDSRRAVQAAVTRAISFGQQLMMEFAADNVLLGITQDGKTGEVLDKMAPVMSAMQSGSLYEAIARAKAITPQQYDEKYVTHARLYAFINKIDGGSMTGS